MPFNRFRAQLKCEALLSCGTLDDWARKRKNFEDFTLTRTSAKDLVASLEEDSKDLYFKGILTLSEALYGISKCLFSWATVRLYYSIFYFLRCSLATKHYAIIRNKSLYLLRAKEGEKPQKKKSNRYRSDHLGVINIYRDLYDETIDKLQSNTIDDQNPYIWLMERRYQVNYREREFHDPGCSLFMKVIESHVADNTLDSLITTYIEDEDYIFCFQDDHACLALPLKRALLTKIDMTNAGIHFTQTPARDHLLRNLLRINGKPIEKTDRLLNFK